MDLEEEEVRSRYANLARDSGWEANSTQITEGYANFLAQEVARYYGTNMLDIDVLQHLCRDFSIEPIPASKTQCKKVGHGRNHYLLGPNASLD